MEPQRLQVNILCIKDKDIVQLSTMLIVRGFLSMQRRLGPNRVGYYGLLQPFK